VRDIDRDALPSFVAEVFDLDVTGIPLPALDGQGAAPEAASA
jgi:hypothetical protein